MRNIFTLLLMLFVTKTAFPQNNSMSIGMNVGSVTYYSQQGLLFTNVMKSSSRQITYTIGSSDWDTHVSIPVDSNGYPLELPYMVDGVPTGVRILFNNYYVGEYVFTWDGEGDVSWNIPHDYRDGKHYVTFDGTGGNVWINIKQSTLGNHIKNIQIIPAEYEGTGAFPVFNSDYLKGLQPFSTIRFMDWMKTNGSGEVHWADRKTKNYYTQNGGISIDYAIEFANLLQSDVWFCVPHKASDDYILNFAKLVKAKLDPNLKIYIEYSNELWNWGFSQAGYVLNNAPDHVNSYVSSDLLALGEAGTNHPAKDAYMMARVFKIWGNVWAGDRDRLVTVAAVQAAWAGNTGRILRYLFDVDGVGADAVAPTAYFKFTGEDHNLWNSMDPADVTPEMILDVVNERYDSITAVYADEHAAYAAQYNLKYIVYEGGQHMQPYKQQNWEYNQAVWAAQIHPRMYDLYVKNLQKHIDIGSSLFVAFSYVGERESKYGSWGHLESIDQLSSGDLKTIAPKYQALVDFANQSVTVEAMDVTNQPVTVSEPSINSIVTDNRISSGSDDVEEALTSGEIYFNSTDIELGDDLGNNGTQTVGLRFQSVNIPQGATIDAAYLEFVVDETGSTATNVVIRAEATDNAPAFAANNGDVTNRALMSAATAWDIPAWDRVGDIKHSPDILAVVQEVVNRSGWSANNDMVFVISGTGTRAAESYEGGASAAPLLHVEYSAGTAAVILN